LAPAAGGRWSDEIGSKTLDHTSIRHQRIRA
jgi:hypothetical protein